MAERPLDITGHDTTLSDQYFDTFRRSEFLEPERALLLAVLEDAVHCYRKYRGAKDHAGRERFREAAEWIMNEGDDWIFSFQNVCEMLGLDPQYIRRGIRESGAKPAAPEKLSQGGGSHRQAA